METIFDFVSNWSHQGLQIAVNGIWLGLALTGLVWLLFRSARNLAGETKHLLWWATLVTVLALPLQMLTPLHNYVTQEFSRSGAIHTQSPLDPGGLTRYAVANPVRYTSPSRNEMNANPAPTGTPSEQSRAGSLALRFTPIVLGSIWLVGLFLMTGRLWRAYRAMIRIKAQSVPMDLSDLPRVRSLLKQGLRRPVRIHLSNKITSPVAAGLGRPTILIPHKVAEALSDEELEAVILHELAHLIRWDDWTKLVQKLVEAVFFFHPAVYLIGRQLELERELACDEWAVAQTGPVDRYARCLTRLVQLTNGSATTLIPGVLTGRKQVFRRFERLLLHAPTAHPGRRFRLRLIGLATAVALAALTAAQIVPAVVLPFDAVSYTELDSSDSDDEPVATATANAREKAPVRSSARARSSSSTSYVATASSTSSASRVIGSGYVVDGTVYGATVRTDDGTVTTTYKSDDLTMSVLIEGTLVLAPDDRSVASLSRRGHVEVTVEEEDTESRLTIDADRTGALEYFLHRDGREMEFDQNAGRWFGDKMQFFVNRTGFGAEERLRQLMEDNGFTAALAYIKDHVDDHIKRHYYETLIDFDHLGKQDLRRIRDQALDELEDEYDRESIRDLVRDRIEMVQNGYPGNKYVKTAVGSDWDDGARTTSYASSWTNFSDASFQNAWDRSNRSGWGRGRDRDTDGEWEARYRKSRGNLQLRMYTYDGHSQIGLTVSLSDFHGLTESNLTGEVEDITFEYRRDPGTFVFEGDFGKNRGGGDFRFVPNDDYIEKMEKLGFRRSRMDTEGLFSLAIHEVDLDYVSEMLELVADRIDLEDLVSMSIHDVDPAYVRQFQELGFDDLDVEELVSFSIHDVEPEFVLECRKLGYDRMSAERLVELSIHDVDIDFIQELAEMGMKDLPLEDLVAFSIHDVDPEFIMECRNLGYKRISPDDLVSMSIHDVDADYIRELVELGLEDIPLDRLIEFRIHNVTPRFIKEFQELGYDDLESDELTSFRIHNVSPRFVRDLAELGYDRVHPDNLVAMKIHNVTTSFIKRLQRRGYDDLTVDELIELKIHGR